MLEDGGFVISWISNTAVDARDTDGFGVFFQKYDAAGNKVGDAQLANSTVEGEQINSDVAGLQDGGFIVTWQSFDNDSNSWDIKAQRYDESGEVVGGEFVVNTQTQGAQTNATTTALEDGGYVVTWQSSHDDIKEIKTQMFDKDGNLVGGESSVSNTDAIALTPVITSLEDGGYAITWQEVSGDSSSVYVQKFSLDGEKVGESSLISSDDSTKPINPFVTDLDDGSFVVSWVEHNENSENNLYVQKFSSDGLADGDKIVVSQTDATNRPEVANLEDSGFVVAYSADDGDGKGVFIQVFDENNSSVGEPIRVNADIDADSFEPHITSNEDGFLVTWTTNNTEDGGLDVMGQQFDNSAKPDGDIFKAGDVTNSDHIVSNEGVLSIDEEDILDFDQLSEHVSNVRGIELGENSSIESLDIETLHDIGTMDLETGNIEFTILGNETNEVQVENIDRFSKSEDSEVDLNSNQLDIYNGIVDGVDITLKIDHNINIDDY